MVKMSVLTKLSYKFNIFPVKIPASYFVDTYILILKVCMERQKSKIVNSVLKQIKVRDLPL